MLDQFLLDRLAYELNPEPMEPIPWPEGHAPTPVSVEASAQGAEASPELILTSGTEGGIAAATSLSDAFIVSNAKSNCTQRFAAILRAAALCRVAPRRSSLPTRQPTTKSTLHARGSWR